MPKTFTVYADPGHAWLKVPLSLIRDLGIVDQISGFSYMSLTHAYLEEDSDMAKFIKAYKPVHGDPVIKERYAEKSRIREYAQYNPKFVHNPVKDGDTVTLKGESVGYVLHIKSKLLISTKTSFAYRFNPSTIIDMLT